MPFTEATAVHLPLKKKKRERKAPRILHHRLKSVQLCLVFILLCIEEIHRHMLNRVYTTADPRLVHASLSQAKVVSLQYIQSFINDYLVSPEYILEYKCVLYKSVYRTLADRCPG